MRLFLRFCKDQGGATALEYAFISGIVSVGLIASWTALGTNVSNKFLFVSNGLN